MSDAPESHDDRDRDDDEITSHSLFDLFGDERPPNALANVTRGLFTMAVSGALMPVLHGLDETVFVGDRARGTFTLMNGQGDFTVFVWDEGGLVAASFDHELGDEYDVEVEDRRPMRYFPGLPSALAPLAAAAIEAADHDVNGGIWLTNDAGTYASAAIEGELGSAANLVKHLLGDDAPHDVIDDEDIDLTEDEDAVSRITRTGVVEPEDAGALFRACDGREPSEAELLRAKEKLADLGITWRDPIADWKRF